MRTRFEWSTFILLSAIMLVGCVTARYIWKSEPIQQRLTNEYFETEIFPVCDSWGCKAFRLTLRNKSNKNIEVNWNKTLYITRGQTSGGFMFEGVVYKDRNNPKPPDIVFGNSSLSKTIWPNNLVYFSSGRYGGWMHEVMNAGENGVYLSVVIDGKEINEKLTVNLSVTQVQN